MNVIEALVTTLTLDPSGYEQGANRAKKAEKGLNDELAKTKKQTQENTKEQDKAGKSLFAFTQKVIDAKKSLLSLAEVYFSVKIFKNIVEDVSQAEASLYRLSGRINTSAQDLQAWGNAAEIMGGNADEARAGLQALSGDLTALRYKGEASGRTVFLAQMGVSINDAKGNLKSLIDIQQDLGNAIEKRVKSGAMTQENATNLLKQAGYDDSTILLLTAEHDKREKILAQQREYNRLEQANAKESQDLTEKWGEFKLLLFTLKSNIFHTFAPLLKFIIDIGIKFMEFINSFPRLSGAVSGFGLAIIPLFSLLRLLTALGGGGGATLFRIGFSLLHLAGKAGAATSAVARFIAPLTRTIGLMMRWSAVLRLLKNPIVALIAIVAWLIKDLRDFGRNGKSILDWASIFDGIHDVIEWFGKLSDKIGEVWDKLKNHDWQGAWESLKSIFSDGEDASGVGGDTSAIISAAQAEIGVSESANRSTVMGYQRDIGYNVKTIDAWCASFVGSRLKKAGFKYLKTPSAAAYMNYGTAVDKNGPIPAGAIGLVNRNGGSGKHVFFIEKDNGNGTVTTIEGNAGNKVIRNTRKKSELAGVRMPVSEGGGQPGNSGATVASGNLAQNQQTAYKAARANGLSDTAARALVANMSGEALHKPTDRHWDGSHYAHGIVQWDEVRANRIKAQFGKMPQNMSVAEQTKAAIWEIQKYYPTTWKALQGGGNAESMVGTLVKDFERPANTSKAISQRVSHLKGLRVSNPMAQPVRPMTNQRLYTQANRNNNNSNLVANNANPHNEVSIGQVVIHTQATDAHDIARSIPSALNNSMAGLAFNMDMGQA